MTAESLLRLYPRAWRERYGDELTELAGGGQLSAQQTIDILAGAADAWLSPSVRAAVRRPASVAAKKGELMVRQLLFKCATKPANYTTRDSLIGAAIILVVSLAVVAIGKVVRAGGYPDAGDALAGMSFSAAMMLSMPFWLLKGQSRTVKTAVIVPSVIFLFLIALLSTRI